MSENGSRVIAEIRKVADEKPWHVNGDFCRYVKQSWAGRRSPSCLVGHGLWRAGLIGGYFYEDMQNNAAVYLLQSRFGFDEDEIEWLTRAQVAQDENQSWAASVKYADEGDKTWIHSSLTCPNSKQELTTHTPTPGIDLYLSAPMMELIETTSSRTTTNGAVPQPTPVR